MLRGMISWKVISLPQMGQIDCSFPGGNFLSMHASHTGTDHDIPSLMVSPLTL